MIRTHAFLAAAILFSGAYFFAAFYVGLDLFEWILTYLARLEGYNVDELVIPALSISAAAMADALRRRKTNLIELEKAKIYKAMISSVHHVMNNFLHQMQWFKMTANRTPGFDPKVLALYDQVIEDASAQIQALSTIKTISEKAIITSVLPVEHGGPVG